jgi:hypothetical protein
VLQSNTTFVRVRIHTRSSCYRYTMHSPVRWWQVYLPGGSGAWRHLWSGKLYLAPAAEATQGGATGATGKWVTARAPLGTPAVFVQVNVVTGLVQSYFTVRNLGWAPHCSMRAWASCVLTPFHCSVTMPRNDPNLLIRNHAVSQCIVAFENL